MRIVLGILAGLVAFVAPAPFVARALAQSEPFATSCQLGANMELTALTLPPAVPPIPPAPRAPAPQAPPPQAPAPKKPKAPKPAPKPSPRSKAPKKASAPRKNQPTGRDEAAENALEQSLTGAMGSARPRESSSAVDALREQLRQAKALNSRLDGIGSSLPKLPPRQSQGDPSIPLGLLLEGAASGGSHTRSHRPTTDTQSYPATESMPHSR